MSTKKLWGGRFEESAAAWIDQFGASISFDQLMANEDIEGSLAHVKMLNETGILTEQEATEIENGLLSLKDDLSAGKLEFSDQNEDIHMNIESLLTEKSDLLPANCTRQEVATIKLPPTSTFMSKKNDCGYFRTQKITKGTR